jgi:hypothetical protein
MCHFMRVEETRQNSSFELRHQEWIVVRYVIGRVTKANVKKLLHRPEIGRISVTFESPNLEGRRDLDELLHMYLLLSEDL